MIYLTVWSCLNDHVVFGYGWSDADYTQEQIEATGDAVVTRRVINPWCGICGSTFSPHTMPTDYTSHAETEMLMAAFQRDQVLFRQRLDKLNATYDARTGPPTPFPTTDS